MPIRKINSQRKGLQPFFFFKGTRDSIAKVSDHEITTALEQAGLSTKSPERRFQAAQRLRRTVQRALQSFDRFKKTFPQDKSYFFLAPWGSRKKVFFRILQRPNGQVLIHQWPVTHGLTINNFQALANILQKGFKGQNRPNVATVYARKELSKREYPFDEMFGEWAAPSQAPGITRGDSYELEIMAPFIAGRQDHGAGFVKRAPPNQIQSIKIVLNPEASAEEARQKRAYYLDQIKKRLGIPIRFIRSKYAKS